MNLDGNLGVKGKVETQAQRLLDFQVRYTVDFGFQPRYRLHAAITGPACGDDDGDQVVVIQSDLPEENQQHHFRETIQSLTRQFEFVGLEAMIKSFMTPKNGISGQSVNGNNVAGS